MTCENDYWNQMYAVACDVGAPSVIFKPRLFIDGNQWCALFGENLQDGVAGFGDSPAMAMRNFDIAWNTKIKAIIGDMNVIDNVFGKAELPYGSCTVCHGAGLSRERRPNGNDKCVNGHVYPSREAMKATNDK